jgi:hypothetical protein
VLVDPESVHAGGTEKMRHDADKVEEDVYKGTSESSDG